MKFLPIPIRHMPAYRWSCPACGSSNSSDTSQCATCCCPASFRATDVENFRREFMAQGGSVGPAAAPTLDANDISMFRVLLSLPLLLLGWWPIGRKKSEARSSHDGV